MINTFSLSSDKAVLPDTFERDFFKKITKGEKLMMNERKKTNEVTLTIGMNNMSVDVAREVIHDGIYGDIEYLNLSFCQKSDTAGQTSVSINAVSKKDVLKLAKAIKEIAMCFKEPKV